MANAAKKRELDENEADRPDYINWQEFNRLVKMKGAVPVPDEDSKDDDGEDELDEAVMGKDYSDTELEDDEDIVLADTPSAARDPDNLLEDRETDVTAPSSLRPDPKDDPIDGSSVH